VVTDAASTLASDGRVVLLHGGFSNSDAHRRCRLDDDADPPRLTTPRVRAPNISES